MTLTLERPVADLGTGNGGMPARRAVVRWAWRLFRREWRQQLLVLALIVVAVTTLVVGAGVAINTPAPNNTGFGNANAMIQFGGSSPKVASDIAALGRTVGAVNEVDDQQITIPGTIGTYDLRAQNPNGVYSKGLVHLVSGSYPTTASQVAVTSGVADGYHLRVGGSWTLDGTTRQVVGIVENPQALLDNFALVLPGQVQSPTAVTLLFDATSAQVASLSSQLGTQVNVPQSNLGGFNPYTFVLIIATVGMLLIGLVSVGGFTVLAQRRMRSIGMLGSLGATDRNIRLVVRANGLVVGVVSTAVGFALGLVAWLVYRPHVQASAHHLVGTLQLPWIVIIPAMALAVITAYLAAARPARAAARVPIVTALSGRPAPPRKLHRSAVPGVLCGVAAYFLIFYAGKSKGNGGGALELVLGFAVLVAATILLAPLAITTAGRLARRMPLPVRMALRDLSRYRSRSGSALAAISLAMLIAATVCVAAAGRYGNPLDYAGPNLANNQLMVYTQQYNAPPCGTQLFESGPNGPVSKGTAPCPLVPSNAQELAVTEQIAHAIGATHTVELDIPDANLVHLGAGRQWNGPIWVATPQLLQAFGILPSQIDGNADILSARPRLAGTSNLDLYYGNSGANGSGQVGPPGNGPSSSACQHGTCVANPPIQELGQLPSGTSAPNTVVTEHAMRSLGLQGSAQAWMLVTSHPLTTSQINDARNSVAALGMSVESKSDAPSSNQVIDWAAVVGMLLALAILAMTIGLIRSETASDLRTLSATGASTVTRRTLTAATAASLAFIGALLGTIAGYMACLAFFSGGSNGDGIGELSNIPLLQLFLILVAMPVLAAAGGWLLSGRDQGQISQQPLE